MNKKSRVILIVVVIILALAAACTLYFTLRNGGAKEINYDTLVEYVQNNKYKEGDKVPGAEEGKETYKVTYIDEDGALVEEPNYRFNSKHELQRLKKDKEGNYLTGEKDSDWEGVTVIIGINISEYKIYGNVKVGGKTVSKYYAVGPSFYSSPTKDSLLGVWIDEFDLSVSYKDPNAGSIWSSILHIGGVILV